MFTEKAQRVIDLAKGCASVSGASALDLPALVAAVGIDVESSVLLAGCLGLTTEQLRARSPVPAKVEVPVDKQPLAQAVRTVLRTAREFAEEVPDRQHPGLIDVRHLVGALAITRDACILLDAAALSRDAALARLAEWYETVSRTSGLDHLTERLRNLRSELMRRVFGQEHAIHAFVEGLFNAEVVAAADVARKTPEAVFVFAGPPGVGKTFLAGLGAAHLDRPFKRFDMSGYSDHQQHTSLVGWARSYMGARPGILTEFVEKNPNAILLFDEIEKCHLNTIQLFLQILDAGVLEDKFLERNIPFRDTVLIFTTNAGRALYDQPNRSGVHGANATFQRKTILDALRGEKDPRTGRECFPTAICSRLATGYPVLFNHLHVNELVKVARAELRRVSSLLEQQHYKRTAFHELLPMCLVLREGASADARTVRAQVEAFVKTELFKFCRLFRADRLEEAFEHADSIHLVIDKDAHTTTSEARAFLELRSRPRILLVARRAWAKLYRESISEVDWCIARTAEDALQTLAREEVNMVLIDLWIGGTGHSESATIQHFDHAPFAARRLAQGQELLRKIHARLPDMPVYLLSIATDQAGEGAAGSIDEELFMACVRAGGARGMISCRFSDGTVPGWQQQRDDFQRQLLDVARQLHREKQAERLQREQKILTFDTAPCIDRDNRAVVIRLRNLRVTRAVAAADVGEVLDDVERPSTCFDDVIGAETAKEELRFFIDYLKNPRRFAALGLKPPKGVLLHGPPGTGKTMLARTMAGESNVAFVPAAAGSFVDIWQGSGARSVRQLFERARRYAPAIVFIDEIDAIGGVRTGSVGGARGEEQALNQLLTEMDGFASPAVDRPMFVLAATNFRIDTDDRDRPERSARTLDPALVRRFSRRILVGLPDTAARRLYLARRMSEGSGYDISESHADLFAEKSVGMTIADLEMVIEAAARKAVMHDTRITGALLIEALDNIREGEAAPWDPALLEGTAYHEAGHAVMYLLSGWLPAEVSIVARADHGGGMRRSEREMKKENRTRDEVLAEKIRPLLGGRAGEVARFGPEVGLSTGVEADFEEASDWARRMVCAWGMDGDFGPLAVPDIFRYREAKTGPIYERINEAAGKILKEQMTRTQEMLEANRQYLDAVAQALLKKNTLYRSDLEHMLPRAREGGTAAKPQPLE